MNYRLLAALGSAIILLLGLAYYSLYRPDSLSLMQLAGWPSLSELLTPPKDPTAGTLPSLVHTSALTLLAIAIFGHRRRMVALSALCVLLMTVSAERYTGTFDTKDVLMALLGCALPLIAYLRSISNTSYKHRFRDWLGASAILGFSVMGITATSQVCDDESGNDCFCQAPCRGSEPNATPVYLTYAQLRSAVDVGDARELSSVGKLYLYGNLIFLNERNQGIHVLDNSDPTNPVNQAFIAIPGNTELAIRNDILHADSYVDLVTIDLRNPLAVSEVDREIEVFPFDAYQNVPDNITFAERDIDPARGVIVGYQ